MLTLFLLLHVVVGTALVGALSHQAASMLRRHPAAGRSFVERYSAVNTDAFTLAVVVLYAANVAIGAIIYPAYRLQVRIPFEEMSLGWAVGLFELKEHFAGIGLGLLPLYFVTWRKDFTRSHAVDRTAITLVLTFIVWWDFIIGHILNNIRGLS
jgi:hypothetical protein